MNSEVFPSRATIYGDGYNQREWKCQFVLTLIGCSFKKRYRRLRKIITIQRQYMINLDWYRKLKYVSYQAISYNFCETKNFFFINRCISVLFVSYSLQLLFFFIKSFHVPNICYKLMFIITFVFRNNRNNSTLFNIFANSFRKNKFTDTLYIHLRQVRARW